MSEKKEFSRVVFPICERKGGAGNIKLKFLEARAMNWRGGHLPLICGERQIKYKEGRPAADEQPHAKRGGRWTTATATASTATPITAPRSPLPSLRRLSRRCDKEGSGGATTKAEPAARQRRERRRDNQQRRDDEGQGGATKKAEPAVQR